MSEAELPASFGRYRVSRPLGEGGMGTVFAAHDDVLGREVAVKALRPVAMQMGGPERFLNEGRAVAKLMHPNIVRVFDVGNESGVPFLVMEMACGGSLKDRLAREALPAHEVRRLGIQIAHALEAAHERGIVHRDVKPANVLESTPGVWKLADFGIAHTPDASLTITGQFLGSPVYAAPESLRTGSFGVASDVYGLACTLYEALTGRKPHEGRSIEVRLRPDDDSGHIHQAVLAAIDAPGLVHAISCGLAQSPSDRPSAAGLAVMIAEGVASPIHPSRAATPPVGVATIGVADSIVTPPKISTEFVADSMVGAPRVRATRSRRNIAIGVGLLALLVVVAIGVSSRGRNSPSAATIPTSAADPKQQDGAALPIDPPTPEPSQEPGSDPAQPIVPGELHAVTPKAALHDEQAARDWAQLVDRLYDHRFDEARDKLAEWEREYGATDETRSLRAQLDALPDELRGNGDRRGKRGKRGKHGD
jgi:serine/threonine-protein kinase